MSHRPLFRAPLIRTAAALGSGELHLTAYLEQVRARIEFGGIDPFYADLGPDGKTLVLAKGKDVFAYAADTGKERFKIEADPQRVHEAQRAVSVYLGQARADAYRAAQDLVRHGRTRIRDYYLDQAAEAMSAANHAQEVTLRAMRTDEQAAAVRGAAAKTELDRVTALLATAERVAGKGAA